MKILLDYFFKITAIAPVPAASTAFLKQVCFVVKPKSGVTSGTFAECISMTQVAALTDNTEAQKLFDAGLTSIYVLASDDLDLAAFMATADASMFFTLLVSKDFTDSDVTAMTLGTYKGVTGVSSSDLVFLEAQAKIENRCAFFTDATVGSQNMIFAFGKLLSNPLNWFNQQYVPMPEDTPVDTLGEAESLFNKRISFVIKDDEYSLRLGFFVAGGQAIVAPYIIKNLQIDLQSRALQYVAENNPQYTKTEAALIEDELSKVMQSYIDKKWLENGIVEIKLEQENFVASGYINVTEPRALWRIFAEFRQSL